MSQPKRLAVRTETGQVVLLFALILPVVLAIGSIVVSVGDWYVHKKHLQTLVDAGAFAGGTAFNGCFQDPVYTNNVIKASALEYSGDFARDSATRNRQLEDPNDVHVALNSAQYWAQANGTDPNLPTPGSGYGLDLTLPPVDAFGAPTADGTSQPCSTKFLDVKATEHEAPLLFRWLPLHPSPKAKARIQIYKVLSQFGLLPWAVPESDPARVAAIVVDEDNVGGASDPSAIRGKWFLDKITPSPPGLGSLTVWQKSSVAGGTTVGLNGSDNFSVIILVSRDPAVSLSGSLSTICNQDPVQTRCITGSTLTSGASFIHAYSTSSSATLQDPQIRGVTLSGGCPGDLSRAYFNFDGGCSIVLQAKVDFDTDLGAVPGGPGNPPTCISVSASPGGNLSWSSDGTPEGIWTGSFTPASGSGPNNVVNLTANFKNPAKVGCAQTLSKLFRRVARPYVGDDNSQPMQYLTVTEGGTFANSHVKDSAANLTVTVGFEPPLVVSGKTDPPILLRIASPSGSQNQALDCDKNVTFKDEVITGCQNPYSINARNGSCAGYGSGNLPQPPVAPQPGDDCIATETGDKTGPLRQAMQARFASPCTQNNWPKTQTDPMPDFNTDPRVVTLFIADETTFQGSGTKIYPIRKFAGFYVTAADGMGCSGDDPPTTNRADVWGHFITYVTPDPNAVPSDQLCQFDQLGTCVPILVE